MSQENVETFKRSTDVFNRGDIDAWLEEFIDPEIEWHIALPGLLTQAGTVYRGHEGVREMLREIAEVLDEMTAEYSEIHEVGDRVVGIGQIHTRGRASGVATDGPFALVGDYRNGKTIRVRTYRDPAEALEAAGLREYAQDQPRRRGKGHPSGGLGGQPRGEHKPG
jgi:ketosteroid isomerase-like protein